MKFKDALLPRQILVNPTPTTTSLPHTCSPFLLPSGGLLNIGGSQIITLTQNGVFQPKCPSTAVPLPVDPTTPGADLSMLDRDPFFASTNPQIYAIAALTVVSYMLVIILFITPRTFFVAGAGGGGGFFGQRGLISGAYGNNSVIGVGGRPWLQKFAALAVAISLTIVTTKTLTWAEQQYNDGYQDAVELSVNVMDGLEVRIVRLISETLLWLAQAQTLIRLFPRHKEKLVIKWCAFSLILLEIVFSILNHFVQPSSKHEPRSFTDAIPALDYLFSLALNIAYATFVMWYTLSKRRFAFWHTNMHNMPLVALLSLTAVLIPVIFFVLDLSEPDIAGWGSYVRWVGAAAASVVVWEWVERIEALERDEKRNGILGREIFDGDEMLEATPSSDRDWPNSWRSDHKGSRPSGGFGSRMSTGWKGVAQVSRRMRQSMPFQQRISKHSDNRSSEGSSQIAASSGTEHTSSTLQHRLPTRPPATASPINRADTVSPGSTVYMVRCHQDNDPTPPISESAAEYQAEHQTNVSPQGTGSETMQSNYKLRTFTSRFPRMANPFGRQRTTPPLEVVQALAHQPLEDPIATEETSQLSILERLHLKRARKFDETRKPVIIIPAPRGDRPAFDNTFDHGLTEQVLYPFKNMSSSERDEQPPDAVLNAMNNSRPISPMSVKTHEISSLGNDIEPPRSIEAQAPSATDLRPQPGVSQSKAHTDTARTDHDR